MVIGSGYTGLNAAIEACNSGIETLVVDRGHLGAGCSTRNGGQISTSIKPSSLSLSQKYGTQRASAIRGEGVSALDWLEEFVKDQKIDCAFSRSGGFHGAHSKKMYDKMCRSIDDLADEQISAYPVSKSEMKNELGTNYYHGGLVFPGNASLHPGRYHLGLANLADAKGCTLISECNATSISRSGGSFLVETDRGPVKAQKLAIATNGYTSSLTPWLRRRVIPIGSYIIATQPLERKLMDRLFPKNRMITDSRKVIYYYRPSPDRTRIIFGGRVSAGEIDPSKSAPKLLSDLTRLFPELSNTLVDRSWAGTVAYSFDELPHIGVAEGMHYAMSYCGSGVSMASYLGMKMGKKISEAKDSETAFDGLTYQTRPYYTGKPWFLPIAVEWYRMLDRNLY